LAACSGPQRLAADSSIGPKKKHRNVGKTKKEINGNADPLMGRRKRRFQWAAKTHRLPKTKGAGVNEVAKKSKEKEGQRAQPTAI